MNYSSRNTTNNISNQKIPKNKLQCSHRGKIHLKSYVGSQLKIGKNLQVAFQKDEGLENGIQYER